MDDKKDMKMRAAIGGIIAALVLIGAFLLAKTGVFTAMRTPDLVEFTHYSNRKTEEVKKIWVNPQQVLYVYTRGNTDDERTVICMNGSSGNSSNYVEVEEPLSTVVKSLKLK